MPQASLTDSRPPIDPDTLNEVIREYIGVPWIPQGKSKGGVDCVGLLACIATDERLELYGSRDLIRVKPWKQIPDGHAMIKTLATYFKRTNNIRPHCIIAMKQGNSRLTHVGIVLENTFIHANITAGRVIESSLTPQVREDVVACFLFEAP